MKKIIYSIALLSGMMFMNSCEDMLDIPQKGTDPIDGFYKTDADAESAVTAMYTSYLEEIAKCEGIWNAYIMGLNYSADDVFAAGGDTSDHADFRVVNEFNYDPSSAPIGTLYNHIYKAIYSANLVINYFGESADTQIKKQAVAQARVMRAWAHMLAAQVYYRPPLVDHLIVDDKPVNAESQKAIFDWCVAECEAAIPDLPKRNGKDDKEGAWIATEGFARFVAGKSALFAGDNAKVVSVMKPLVESSNYDLVPGERFRDLFHVEGDGCEEKIFEFNFTANNDLGGWWENINRGRWMVANVLNWRGDDIVGQGLNPQICSTGGWGGGSINHEFAHKMLANEGDSYRRKATFLTSDEFFYDEELCGWRSDATCTTREQKEFDPERGIRNSNGSFARSDVMEVKMMCHPNDVDLSIGSECNQTNFCLARLGEAYLIYAEACLTEAPAEAKKYINKIQQRAGAPVSESVNLQVLQDEKQYELWFEGCRWHDIVRWGIAKECYDKVLDNIPYQFDEYWTSGGTKPHKLVYEVRHPWKDIKKINIEFIKNKHEYWPIPQSILDVNDQMQQVWGGWVTSAE
ncbi:MAG: RagB/SusD family nutrient uptake outer membrane protein [Mediterranea massiliensis]|nr:RagB/SusD family nutrient uptake outer membrane protein [Mediterranea massiliensis]